MAHLKYMGVADQAILKKGEDFGGRVSEGLASDVKFSRENNWTVDTAEAGITDDQVAALLDADPDRFRDVTDLKRIPSNLNQRTFLGHKKTVESDGPNEADPQARESVTPGGSVVAGGDATGTTVGGSTTGDATKAGRKSST